MFSNNEIRGLKIEIEKLRLMIRNLNDEIFSLKVRTHDLEKNQFNPDDYAGRCEPHSAKVELYKKPKTVSMCPHCGSVR